MPQNKPKKPTPKKKPAKKVASKKATTKKQLPKKSFQRKYIGWGIAGLLGITYIVALFAALNTKLLPTKYLLAAMIVSAVIVAVVALANIRNNWKSLGKSIALVSLSLVVLLANGYVYSVSKSTNDFFANIESGEYRLESYSIATKTSYDITLKNGKSIGYIADDQNNSELLPVVADKTKASQVELSELASLTVALDDRNVEMIVVRSSTLPLLEQNQLGFYQSLIVLETFDLKVKNSSSGNTIDITKPYAVYIAGIDTYGSIESVSRSDVNIVAVINPQTKQILLINTPRDYYVQLHGTTGLRDKLTHAGIYGADMSRLTLADLYQTPIDYSVRVNFTSLLKIIDAIGGVSVVSDNAFTSGSYTFVKGVNELDSKKALEFSRNRKAFEDGDRTRGKNQQRVIEAIIAKVNDPRYLLRYQSIAKSLGDSFQTNASKEVVAAIVKQQMNDLGSWQVESVSADGRGSSAPTYSMGSQNLYVMEPDINSLNMVRAKIQELVSQK